MEAEQSMRMGRVGSRRDEMYTPADGTAWWDYYAQNHNAGHGVAGGSTRVFARPIPLTVGNATNIKVKDISIINSPFWSK